MILAGHVASMGIFEKCVQKFGLKVSREEITWKTETWWEDNIKTNPMKMGFDCVDWIHLAENGDLRRTVMKTTTNFGIS
jgi:hypothetical protein